MTIYEEVTKRILQQLDAGKIPWRKTWCSGLPKSLATGKEYRGINILVLGSTDYTSRYWVTYRQAFRLGGHVRKGERATPVVFWKWRTPEEMKQLAAKTGNENPAPCVPFVSAVFNLEQVEGVTAPPDEIEHRPNHRLEVAELMLQVLPDKPEIIHRITSQPAYAPAVDRITLPHLSQFENADEYSATLFHELTHASGHPRRLNRFAEADGDQTEKYSFEELVAEFGAAFLCAFAGIKNRECEELQASYIEGWARVFRQDSRILVRAASAAQHATDYIRGKPAVAETILAAA